MEWSDTGVVLSTRRHGETSAVVTLLTAQHGRHAGLVRGGAGARARGIYQAGNEVSARWRARLPEHLGTFNCEMIAARAAALLDDPRRLAGLSGACALAEAALPERHPYPAVYAQFTALLDALERNERWLEVYAAWEVELLSELGFGAGSFDLCRHGGRRKISLTSRPAPVGPFRRPPVHHMVTSSFDCRHSCCARKNGPPAWLSCARHSS